MSENKNKFEIFLKVNSHDTDMNGNVRPSILQRYIHEAANLQFQSTHPTLDELRYEQGKGFILSKVAFNVKKQLSPYDEIRVVTWGGVSTGATFIRCGAIYLGEELVAEEISLWALLDIAKRRICRVKDVTLGFESCEELPSIEMPTHMRFPEGLSETLVGERRVYNSDTDLNGHMNNTNYPDMLCNYIPSIENKRVTAFSINYLHEARLGETFKVYHSVSGDTHYIKTVKDDETVGVQAIIKTESIGGVL